MNRIVAFACVWALVACAPAKPAVSYQGSRESPVVSPQEVQRSPTVPRGATRLGTLSVSCTADAGYEAFSERSLANIDCTRERLLRMLAEAGVEAGGDTLAELACTGTQELRCQAILARRADPRQKLRGAVVSEDVFGRLGAEVRVSFAPSGKKPSLVPASAENVRELPELPPSHRVVGSLEARCEEGCSELVVRDGLRIAAGRLGVRDVVSVRCFAWASGHRCLGTVAAPERPEELSSLPARSKRSARAPRSHRAG